MLANSSIINDGENTVITVLWKGQLKIADLDHPFYDQILAGVTKGDPEIIDLFDLSQKVSDIFEPLTEHISVKDGVLYMDSDPVHNSLASKVIEFLEAGVDDWEPLVEFFERVYSNPTEHSRVQLYDWLSNREYTITDYGMIIGYKGMYKSEDDEGPYYRPTNHGHIIVNGQDFASSRDAKQRLGDIIEMPRSEVKHNPSDPCSVGLHIGDFNFAKSYGSALLKVLIDPRDVVSVPTEANSAKMRVCRYTLLEEISKVEKPAAAPVEHVKATPNAWVGGDTTIVPEWTNIVSEAKAKKKGVQTVAKKYGYEYVAGDKKALASYKRVANTN